MPAKKPPSARDRSFRAGRSLPQNVSLRFPVVGIGASAGGLEAATLFFKEPSPHLGMAYVLVLHLDPARESKVTEILARTTILPVLQAKDGMRVEPDHVYVIPPNCEMTIDHWVLHLREPGGSKTRKYNHRYFPAIAGCRSRKRCHRGYSLWNRFRRHPRSGRHQGRSGHHVCPGTNLRQVRWHAGERHRLWLRRLHPDARRNSQGNRSHSSTSLHRGPSHPEAPAVGRRQRYGADIPLAATHHDGRFLRIQVAYHRPPHSTPHGSAEDRRT